MIRDVCAFTSVCLEDVKWIEQYLSEVTRMKTRFAVHLDRCIPEDHAGLMSLTSSSFCVGQTLQRDKSIEFRENHKQPVFDLIAKMNQFRWAMAWDIDETFTKNGAEELNDATRSTEHCLATRYVHLWGDVNHYRADMTSWRDHLYNLRSGKWKWRDGITNGPRLFRGDSLVLDKSVRFNLTRLHHGVMTEEDRKFHKDRWDRIYTAAAGRNPYNFWNHVLDKSITADVRELPDNLEY